MSVAAPPAGPTAVVPSAGRAWLFGPSVDSLFGYGLLFLISVPVLYFAFGRFDHWLVPVGIVGGVNILLGTPHYGATILRVYAQRQDRRRYAFFTVWITAALLIGFVGGLYNVTVGAILLTLYVTWNPWHVSGQNYGLAVMYIRRAGVEMEPALKRPLYVSFVLSAALAIVWIHMLGGSLPYSQRAADDTGTLRILTLGIPQGLTALIGEILLPAYLACLGVVAWRLRGALAFSRQGPVWILIGSQALWFTIPAILATNRFFSIGAGEVPFLAVWISAAHSIQYLWVTSYYAGKADNSQRPMPFVGKALLAGCALYLPIFLFAPSLLGPAAPFSAAAAVLGFAVINLHHFILDGAIWKLNDGRVARALIADVAPDEAGEGEERRRTWLKPALLTLGAVILLIQLQMIGFAQLVSDPKVSLPTLRLAAKSLSTFGYDTPTLWMKYGAELQNAGHDDEALAAFRRALAKNPNPPAWIAHRIASLLLALPEVDTKTANQAVLLARGIVQEMPGRIEGYETLAHAHALAGRPAQAERAALHAIKVAKKNAPAAQQRALEARLVGYGALDPDPAARSIE